MRVRRQVERHVVEEHGEIGAMIQIEAAQKILVGLAAACVLSDDDTGHCLQNFTRAQNRAIRDFLGAHGPLRGRGRNANRAILPTGDDYFGEMGGRLVGSRLIGGVLGVGMGHGRQGRLTVSGLTLPYTPLWLPSQNGLFLECLQAHQATVLAAVSSIFIGANSVPL